MLPDYFLTPRSIAVIGASEGAAKIGGKIMATLISCGYEGRLLPINPRGGVLHGLPAFFQMQMSTLVFNGIETRGVETFIDDIVVHAADFETLLIRLKDVLERLAKWNLRVKRGQDNAGWLRVHISRAHS